MDTGTARRLPREIWILVSASFVIALGFGIVAPALPQFARSFDVSVTAATVVISSFAFMRLAFAPASGRLVQKLGERPVYITGVLIVAASTGACALATEYWQLLLFRSLGGIGSTMFTVSAMGLLIRIAPPTQRGRVSGLYASSFLMGSISGPLVGGLLVGFGLRVPFVIYAVALVIAAAVVFFSLRRSHLASPDLAPADSAMTLRDAWGAPSYRAALASNFAFGGVVFGVRVAMVPLFVVEALGQDVALAGIALTVFAVGNAAVLVFSGRLSDRYGRKPFVITGLVICGVSTVAMGLTDNLVAFFVLSATAGIGSGIMSPAQQAAVADVLGAKARGGPVLATFQMVSDIGGVLGPVAAGLLAEYLSYGVAFAVTGAVMVAAAGVWVLVPGRGGTTDRADQP
ncbi:MFS transporter [Rhodococcus triatomae]|uniref:Predicted arabinose efflux permease, MFS family n=1 Tax=Rhodococcus triatomae TaxID=300028 RepID=A0A1G8F0X0_9NOCA|nr:MFS transporter [Rhodococcus triatomae]QNG19352.1 MFS transporter [Rhodococcus triatomae]QNG24735.1 MFS transporter [Rhodococcus triatomae]SDH75727.1 Predicted arabinose efflux permease, MFS family [Rhodococcus triatomae]